MKTIPVIRSVPLVAAATVAACISVPDKPTSTSSSARASMSPATLEEPRFKLPPKATASTVAVSSKSIHEKTKRNEYNFLAEEKLFLPIYVLPMHIDVFIELNQLVELK